MIRLFIIWLAASMMCTASTLEVPGTYGTVQAALDAAAAGDVINIAAGTYAERPTTSVAGTSGSRITVQASGSVTMLGIVINHAYYDVTGITFAGWTTNNVNNACVDLGDNGDNARIINCQIRDGVKIKGTDITFNDTNPDTITSATGGFTAAGFAPGQTVQVYRGESGDTPLNNGQAFLISSVSDNTITLDAGASVTADTADTVYLSASIGYGLQAGTGVDGLVVRGCTFENLGADCQYIIGTNWIVEDCLFTDTGGFDILNYSGTNGIWRRNIVRDCPWEVYDPSPDVWDNWSAVQASNIVFEFNWIDSFDGVIGYNKGDGDGSGVIYRYNSFSNIPGILIVEMDNVTVEHNTFYAVGSTQSTVSPEFKRHPLEFDGTQTSRTGIVVKNNAFIGCGRQDSATNTSGWYGTLGTVAMTADYNLITGTSASSWEAKPGVAETNGINGGDPVLVNAADPDGADNIAFSADDGLEPNTGSPLLGAAGDGYEIGAHMDVGSYFVSVYGNNANPGTVRAPWATVGYALTQANAGETMVVMGGVYSESIALGVDGSLASRIVLRSPGATTINGAVTLHRSYWTVDGFTFADSPGFGVHIDGPRAGLILKNLVVRDSGGQGIRMTNIGGSDPEHGPQNILVQDCTVLDPGHNAIELVGEGGVVERCRIERLGGDAFRIHGRNLTVRDNTVIGIGTAPAGHPDCFQMFGNPGVNNLWAKNIVIERNFFMLNVRDSTHTEVAFSSGAPDTITRTSGSWITDGFQVNDQVAIFGTEVAGNTKLGTATPKIASMTDTVLTLTSSGSLVNDASDVTAKIRTYGVLQPCQMDGPTVGETEDITIRNNVFYGVSAAGTCQYPGTNWTNNTFYNVAISHASVFNYGATGSGVVKNNIFFGCGRMSNPDGNDPARGWYNVQSASSIEVDYNYVGSANFGAKNSTNPRTVFDWYEPNGRNGGNPLFVDVLDPLGPDGIAFTADDGLRLQAGSPLLGAGEGGADIGAYGEGAVPPPAGVGTLNATTTTTTTITISQ